MRQTKHIARADLEIKSVDREGHTIRGIATTPGPDRIGDVVEPMGARFAKEIPLFLYHDSRMQVGTAKLGPVTKTGIPFEAHIPDVVEPGNLKDMVEEAWHRLKYKLLKTTSIGFMPLNDKVEQLKSGGLRWLETEILELSLVPIPMNPDAQVSYIKSIDDRLRAESDRTRRLPTPGASGNTKQPQPSPKGKTMKVFNQDTLASLQDARKEKAARMAELLELKEAQEDGFSEEQRSEFNGLRTQIADTDDEIAVCETHVGNIQRAKPVEGSRSPYGFARKFTDSEPKFKGEIGIKRFIATTIAQIDAQKGMYRNPSVIAEQLFGKTNPTLVAVMKANEMPGGGSGSGEWFSELVQADARYTGDFIEYLYGMTVFDRLPLRPVPHNVVIKGQDAGFTGYWVGESKPIPMSVASASSTSTAPLKVAGLTVLSNELIRDSSPAALGLVGESLREALAQIVDSTFFSTSAAVSGVSPAGILNGLSAGSSSGNDAFSIADDVKALFAPFITAKNAGGTFVWVMTPTLALSLSLMTNALGQKEFTTINSKGGTFLGYEVFVGDNIGTGDVILMKPSDIWKIGDLGVSLSVSTEAMIEQSSAPTGATDTPVAASQMFTSMFQEESSAIKVVRPINWGKRRTGAVTYIGNAAWGSDLS